METKNELNSIFMDRLKLFKSKFQENIQGFDGLDEEYMKEADNIITELHSIYVRAAMLGKVSDEEVNKRLEAPEEPKIKEAKEVVLVKLSEIEEENKK